MAFPIVGAVFAAVASVFAPLVMEGITGGGTPDVGGGMGDGAGDFTDTPFGGLPDDAGDLIF
ncbi:MAG TPA: hypothetical protein VIM12_13590 [Noviherbaspirillum sp.]|uniref:hypothetical protein n=1 Tax=Noviherbaspirillum sp. TaxID=1926288 RepID=UPI002F95F34C